MTNGREVTDQCLWKYKNCVLFILLQYNAQINNWFSSLAFLDLIEFFVESGEENKEAIFKLIINVFLFK